MIPKSEAENWLDKLNKEIGFEHGDEAEKIIGVTDAFGTFAFMVMWKGREGFTLVPNKIAREKCPQIVIDFYESRLQFTK